MTAGNSSPAAPLLDASISVAILALALPRGSACELRRRLLRHLLEEFRRPLVYFGLREIFLARGDPPGIPGRIGDRTGPVAPELIGHRHLYLRALAERAIEERVAVLHVEPERSR